MSDETAEPPLTPAELRVRALLEGMREAPAPGASLLPARVALTARWQRSTRRVLLGLATTVEAMAGGMASLAGRRRRR